MDKLQMAQDYIIAEVRRVGICSIDQDKIVDAWEVAETMQAKAEERKPSGRPEALCEVDWRQAPSDAAAYIKLSAWDIGAWIDELGIQIEDAPSFGFTGSHIAERPHGF